MLQVEDSIGFPTIEELVEMIAETSTEVSACHTSHGDIHGETDDNVVTNRSFFGVVDDTNTRVVVLAAELVQWL